MDQGLQKYIKELLKQMEYLPEVAEGSLEAEFRESVKLLCEALKENPPDENNARFVAPNPFTD